MAYGFLRVSLYFLCFCQIGSGNSDLEDLCNSETSLTDFYSELDKAGVSGWPPPSGWHFSGWRELPSANERRNQQTTERFLFILPWSLVLLCLIKEKPISLLWVLCSPQSFLTPIMMLNFNILQSKPFAQKSPSLGDAKWIFLYAISNNSHDK